MTLKEFIDKWKDKPCDFDGWYGTQCMDLMHFYVYEMLGIKDATVLAAPSAKQVYLNFRWGDLFEKIDNTPNGLPEEGDLIFWDNGEWGHVAIFIEGNLTRFTSFDANWPVGSLPHVQEHNYDNVLGWLRAKNGESDSELSTIKIQLELLQAKYNELDKELDDMRASRNDWKKKYNELSEKSAKELSEKQEHIESLQNTLSEVNANLVSATKMNSDTQAELKALREEHSALKDEYDDYGANKAGEIEILQNNLTNCTENCAKIEVELSNMTKRYKTRLKKVSIWEFIKVRWF